MGRWRQIQAYLDAVSEAWPGWRSPPVQRAFDEAGWEPDQRGTYCGRCGETVGPGEASESGCAACRSGGGIGDDFVRLGRHADALREWILAIKYVQWAAMGSALGGRLGAAVRAARVVEPDTAVVVPMPMPWQRRLYRGIDHARVIAAAVAAELDAPLASCLARSNGPPMVALTATERLAVGSRGMRVARRWGGWSLHGLDAVIVDDVRTTGSSLRAAVRLLRSLGARKVVGAVIAVADDRARRPSLSAEKTAEVWL